LSTFQPLFLTTALSLFLTQMVRDVESPPEDSMTPMSSAHGMPAYIEWRTSEQATQLLQMTRRASFPEEAREGIYMYTEVWAKVVNRCYFPDWELYLPHMHSLCTLGYFLVEADVLSRGNARAAVEFVLDLLTSMDTDSAPGPDHDRWIVRLEEIQAALDATG
jgi:hypothetical protein